MNIHRLKLDLDTLVEEMLDSIDQSYFERSDSTFLDPCVGGGQFVLGVERRLKEHGHSDKNIAGRVFSFAETILDVGFIKNKYSMISTPVVGNFLEKEFTMKFDVFLTNPPFQNPNSQSSSGKLWGKIVQKGFEVVADGGVVGMVTPNSWTKGEVSPQGNGKLLKLLAENNTTHVNNIDCGEHFPKIGVTFSYFITEKKAPEGKCQLTQNGVQTEFDMSACRFIPKNLEAIELVHKFFSHEAFDNYLITNTRNHHIDFTSRGKTEVFTNGKIQMAKSTEYDEDPKVVIPWANTFDKTMYGEFVAGDQSLVFPCKKSEMKNLINVITSKLYQFCNAQLRMAHHNEAARMFPKVDLSRKWTDEELYAHFELTSEEIDMIENAVC